MFDYNKAFARNIGWVTPEEQLILKNKVIAIGGLGGVGGSHLMALARMGFSRFHIADMDTFDYSNFNRQEGATVHTVGQSKAGISSDHVLGINPEAQIKIFKDGLNESNIDEFLDRVDIYVDSLDIFAVNARKLVFRTCHKKNIPAFTCAPLAMGASFLAFTKDSMSFDDYFGLKDLCPKRMEELKDKPVDLFMYVLETFAENVVYFIGGVAPRALQRYYLVDPRKVDFFRKDLPSYKPAIDLAAGVMCSNIMKYLLKRGDVLLAPRSIHFDAYLNKTCLSNRVFGHKNPLAFMIRRIIREKIHLPEKIAKLRINIESLHQRSGLPENISDQNLYNILCDLKLD